MPNSVRPYPAVPGGLPAKVAWSRAGILTRMMVLAMMALLSGPPAGRAETTPPAPAESWFDSLLAPLNDLSRWVSGLFSHDEHFVADEIEQFKHVVDNDLTPFDGLVRQAGFRLASVSVGARLEPQIGLTMTFQRRLSESDKAALMATITDPKSAVGTVERSIIMTLLNASESAYVVRSDKFELSQVTIDLETVPKVTLTMAPVSHWP